MGLKCGPTWTQCFEPKRAFYPLKSALFSNVKQRGVIAQCLISFCHAQLQLILRLLLILRTNDCQQSITFVCANRSVNFAVVAAAILCFCLLKLEWKWCFSTWDKCKIQWLLIYLRMSIRRHAKTNSTYFTSYLAFKKLA